MNTITIDANAPLWAFIDKAIDENNQAREAVITALIASGTDDLGVDPATVDRIAYVAELISWANLVTVASVVKTPGTATAYAILDNDWIGLTYDPTLGTFVLKLLLNRQALGL